MVNSARFRWMLAAAIVAAILALVIYILLRLGKEQPVTPPQVSTPPGVDVSLEGLRFSEAADGVKKWDLVADKAQYDKGRNVTLLTAPVMILPPSEGRGSLRLSAKRAHYLNDSHDVKLEGDVLLTGDRGLRFTTERAEYDAAASMIRSASRVRLQQPGLVVEGTGMELGTVTRDIRILSGVTAVIHPSVPRLGAQGKGRGQRAPRE